MSVDVEEAKAVTLQEKYDKLSETATEIGDALDAASNSTVATKRRISSDLAEAVKGRWEPQVNKLIEQLGTLDEEVRAGILTGFVRALRNSDMGKQVDAYIEKLVEAAPKEVAPTLSEDQRKELSKQYANTRGLIVKIIELGTVFGEDNVENWVVPPIRRGAVGKRGQRALTSYSWFIDGEEVAEDDNSVAGVAKLLGFEKSGEFTQALRDAKVDTKTPPKEFEVELKGRKVSAVGASTDSDDAPENDEPEAE